MVRNYDYCEVDQRLSRMIEMAEELGVTLDDVVRSVGRADQRTFLALSEIASKRPRNMKSNVTP